MKEKLIEYKTAKLAKEKEFDWNVFNGYKYFKHGDKELITNTPVNKIDYFIIYDKEKLFTGENFNQLSGNNINISAPTQSLLQKWLRDKHKIHIVVISNLNDDFFVDCRFSYQRANYDENLVLLSGKIFKSYEEALEGGLFQALKLIK